MAQSGRVPPSKSPFFQTTSQSIGIDPYSKKEWDNNRVKEQKTLKSFQFSRESDKIGYHPDLANDIEVPINFLNVPSPDDNTEDPEAKSRTPEEILKNYNHNTKTEHPRYMTSAVLFLIYLQ
jgi:hypothetical protein